MPTPLKNRQPWRAWTPHPVNRSAEGAQRQRHGVKCKKRTLFKLPSSSSGVSAAAVFSCPAIFNGLPKMIMSAANLDAGAAFVIGGSFRASRHQQSSLPRRRESINADAQPGNRLCLWAPACAGNDEPGESHDDRCSLRAAGHRGLGVCRRADLRDDAGAAWGRRDPLRHDRRRDRLSALAGDRRGQFDLLGRAEQGQALHRGGFPQARGPGASLRPDHPAGEGSGHSADELPDARLAVL